MTDKAFCTWCGNFHAVANHRGCAENVAAGLAADGVELDEDDREMWRDVSLAALHFMEADEQP